MDEWHQASDLGEGSEASTSKEVVGSGNSVANATIELSEQDSSADVIEISLGNNWESTLRVDTSCK